MLGLNVNFSRPSVNQYKKQQNSSIPMSSNFSQNQIGDTVSFGNVPQKVVTSATGVVKKFSGVNFFEDLLDPNTYTTMRTFSQEDAGSVISKFNKIKEETYKRLGQFVPDDFNQWAKEFIRSTELDYEIKCLNPDSEKSALALTRSKTQYLIETYDKKGRISDKMTEYLFKEETANKFPKTIEMEDGSKWEVKPDYWDNEYIDYGNDFGTQIKGYTALKFEKAG